MACSRRLPPSPLGRNSSLHQTLHTEEKHAAEAKIENPEKACGKDGGVKKKRTMRRPRSKRPYLVQTKSWQENMKVLRAAAACVYINKQNPEEKSWEENAGASGYANVKDFEADCDNIGVHLLAEVATGLSLAVEEKEEHGIGEKAT